MTISSSMFRKAGRRDAFRPVRLRRVEVCPPGLGSCCLRYGMATTRPCRSTMPPVSIFVRIARRSEEHTSELQSLMRISYAVFCLKKKRNNIQQTFTLTYHTNTIQHQITTLYKTTT